MHIDHSKDLKVQWTIIYLIKRGLLSLFGPTRTLKILLRTHWLLRRVAYETAGIKYGDEFQNLALGLSDELLASFISNGDRVADLGCGAGRWARASARSAGKVFGIDTNPVAISEAETLGGGVEYLNIDLSTHLGEMPEVDLVLMIHFLEHIENPSSLLNGLRGKTKRIVIEVPDFEGDPLNYPRFWTGEPFYYDTDHVREFTLTELVTLLQSTGWHPAHVSQKGGTLLVVADKH
jgi:2-polyprenyl-3-methyl-5-hydroxy-6-metoxy-1,4-benzoquinol methylase